jgi:hypothetical protein
MLAVHRCVVPGCLGEAKHSFGVRLRKPAPKRAVWAPETRAYICDEHARSGMRVTVLLEPTDDQTIETHVMGVATAINRITPIRQTV